MKIKAWINAFRLRTLPLSVSGIMVGSFIAYKKEAWNTSIFVFCIITTILFQIISNLANDYGDGVKGTDNAERIGPERAVQSGEISPFAMRNAVIICSLLALLSSAYLIYIGTQNMPNEMLYFYAVLALLCILAAITYTIGKKAYGYNGLGDVFVFIFFGFVSVLGSLSLYTKTLDWNYVYPAATIGLLSTAVLNLNNMRDRINDAKSNKNTLVVKMGPNIAKLYHAFLIIIALICWVVFISAWKQEIFFFSLLPFIFLFLHLRKVMHTKDEKEYDPELKKVALSTFALCLLWAFLVIFT
jgi:1,4-dihydroxy-2-naphthoate octaprenyltransferase